MTIDLPGFETGSFLHEGKERVVYRAGEGPAVLVISEIPGITPAVADFARRVVAIGCTAVMPSLFGTPGKDISNGYALKSVARACISSEFVMFARRRTSPITSWLRALARYEHERCGGPGVGVVGMCLTGGFALGMLAEPSVIAPVLSQPSLPTGIRRVTKRDLGISDADLSKAKDRVDAEGLCVLGLRFTGDALSPPERFERLREEFGDHFVSVEIDSSPGNPYDFPKQAHSVLTEELRVVPGNPTNDALELVLDLFRDRLLVS